MGIDPSRVGTEMAGGPSRNQFIQLLNVSGFQLVPSPTPNRWLWILLFNLTVHSYCAGIPSSLDASLHSNSNYLSNDIVIHRDNQRCRIDQTRTSSGDMESSRLETPHPIDPWTPCLHTAQSNKARISRSSTWTQSSACLSSELFQTRLTSLLIP